jgi:hypothetical protein
MTAARKAVGRRIAAGEDKAYDTADPVAIADCFRNSTRYPAFGAWPREKPEPTSYSTRTGIALTCCKRRGGGRRLRDPSAREDAYEGDSGCGRDGYALGCGIGADARRPQE